jgi:succinyl-CoA synthetase beta subunit
VRLTESTSKALLARYGLLSPPSEICSTVEEARTAAVKLGGHVYVKAQLTIGDRSALGLIKAAKDANEAASHAQELIDRVVDGVQVDSVLVERALQAEFSAYVSVHVDDSVGARVLRIGSGGGSDYRPGAAEIQLVIPVGGLEMFQVRTATRHLGISGRSREAVTRAAFAVAKAAREWHAYTVEVNPLFVTADGPIAIDAKCELDDYSLATVPEPDLLPTQAESPREREARAFQQNDHRGTLRYVQLVEEHAVDGMRKRALVGSHSVGGGESLVVFDALDSVGLEPANYCDTSGAPSQAKVAFAANLIASQPHIVGYFFSSCIANQPLSITAAGLVSGLDAARWRGPTVVRIAGNEEAEARSIVEAWAAERGVRAVVVGREVDEWQAAELLATILSDAKAA